MYLKWPQTEPWEALREVIHPVLEPVLHEVAAEPALSLAEGLAVGPMLALSREGLLLNPELLGPQRYACQDQRWLVECPRELAPLALDRWRRSTGIILEGLLLRQLADRLGVAPESLPLSWWTIGAAADRVDRLDPELGWLWQSAAGLLSQPWQGMIDHPRRGAWFFRWRRSTGRPLELSTPHPPAIEPQEWAEFGRWCRDPLRGPALDAPLLLSPALPRPAPTDPVRPLSHHPVRWSAGPAGLRVSGARVSGAAIAPPVRLGGGQAVVAVLGAVSGGPVRLDARPSRLAARWSMVSGQIGQRMGVAEGIVLDFLPGGRLEIRLGNAWVGPADRDGLALAKQLAASGAGTGRWQIRSLSEAEGQGTIVLSDLDIDRISVHPRRKGIRRFALPAQNHLGRVRKLLDELSGKEVTFSLLGGSLVLTGRVREWDLQIRLRKAG